MFQHASPSSRRLLRAVVALLLVAPLLLGLLGAEAWGCPTCKDGVIASDDAATNMARGYFYSILLMLAMPFTLAGCFGMYIWREYRRQQIGTMLIRQARQWAKEQGLQGLLLEATTKNYPALCLYEKLGFQFCGFNDHYYENQDIALFFVQVIR